MKKYLPLQPPAYNSLEENYKATLVYTLAWSWIIGVTSIISVITMLLPAFWERAVFVVATINVTGITCLWLNRRGNIRMACLILPVALWIIATSLAFTAGGIYAPAVVAYLPVIITSGFLLGGMAGLTMAGLCLFTALGFVILGAKGFLPATQIVHKVVGKGHRRHSC